MMGKKAKIFFSVFIIAIVFMIYPSVTAYASDKVSIENIDMKVNLLDNGDVYVEEYLSMKFDGKFNGAFRDLSTKGTGGINDFKAYLVENGSESEFSYDKDARKGDYGVYKVEEKKDSLYRIQMFAPSKNITRKFKFTYKLMDCATLYNDAGELYFNFWDKGYDSEVKSFKGQVVLPKDSKEPLNVYIRGKKTYDDIRVTGNKSLSFEAKNLRSSDFISARVLFSRDVLNTSAKIEDYAGKQKIIDKEASYDMAIAKKEENRVLFGKIMIGIFIVFTVINVFFIMLFAKRTKRKHVAKNNMPKLCTPAIVSMLMGVMSYGKIFIATILDLNQKGYLGLRNDGDDKNNYIIKLMNVEGPSLMSHENYFLRWLSDISDMNSEISTDEIEKQMKNSSSEFSKGFNKWVKEIDKEYGTLGYKDRSNYKFGGIMLILFIVELLISVGLCVNGSIAFGIIGILESVMMLILSIHCFVRITDEGYDEKSSWKYIKGKFMNESFKEIAKDYPLDKYMPYFIALGVGPDIFKSFKNFAVNNEEYRDSMWLNHYFEMDTFTKGASFIYLSNTSFGSNSIGGGNISTGGGGGVGGGGAGGF